MSDKENISTEDMDIVKSVIQMVKDARTEAQLATLALEKANLHYKNTVLSLYVKYSLTEKDEIDNTTGEITRNKDGNNEESEKDSSGASEDGSGSAS